MVVAAGILRVEQHSDSLAKFIHRWLTPARKEDMTGRSRAIYRATRIRTRRKKKMQLFILLLCFDLLGTNRGPTDRIQQINKHSMICQVETIELKFLSEKHSDKTTTCTWHCIWFTVSEKVWDRKGLLKKTGMLLFNITVYVSWATKQEMLLVFHVLRWVAHPTQPVLP